MTGSPRFAREDEKTKRTESFAKRPRHSSFLAGRLLLAKTIIAKTIFAKTKESHAKFELNSIMVSDTISQSSNNMFKNPVKAESISE